MLERLRRCAYFIESEARGRWIILAILAVCVSVMEATGAFLVYLLLRMITLPSSPIVVPLIGDLQDISPGATRNQIFLSVAIFLAVFFLIRSAVFLLQIYLQNRIAQNAGARLAARLLRGYLHLPYAFHLGRNSAELMRKIFVSAADIARSVFAPATTVLSEILVALGILMVLIFTAPGATFAVMGLFGLMLLLVFRVLHPRLETLGYSSMEEQEWILESLQQSLGGIRDIRVLGTEERFADAFGELRLRLARTDYLRSTLGESPRVIIETLLILLVIGFLIATLSVREPVAESLSVLGLFAYGALRILPSMNRIIINLNNIRFVGASIDSVYEDLITFESATDQALRADPGVSLSFEETIRLQGVSFHFEGSSSDVLSDIDLNIGKNEFLGIVGPTGCGKSTLVDLILGLLTPTQGTVTVDGIDLRGNEAAWHRNLGVVSQTIFILDDTIRNNVAFGIDPPEIDEARINEAIELAQLQEAVVALPDLLDTRLGEGGSRFSAGQRQRVAIARALYRRPDVLVLDEATSALDTVTEDALTDALTKGHRRTMIAVAHRLSTVRKCDRIVLLSHGRIQAIGSYDELVAESSEFRRMTR